jgi:hypothetical protein
MSYSNSDTKLRMQRKDAHHIIGGRTRGTEVPFRSVQTFIRRVPVESDSVEAYTKRLVVRRWDARIKHTLDTFIGTVI